MPLNAAFSRTNSSGELIGTEVEVGHREFYVVPIPVSPCFRDHLAVGQKWGNLKMGCPGKWKGLKSAAHILVVSC